MTSNLRFRRQFLLSNEIVEELRSWQCRELDGIYLYAHPDLCITAVENDHASIVMLGSIFDPAHPERTNQDIVSSFGLRVFALGQLIQTIKPYVGRYVIVYKDETDFSIIHDPLGLREVYYCTKINKVIAGSQPNLLDEFSEPRLGITKDIEVLRFCQKDINAVRSGRLWVGNETCFDAIEHLMPNHYLDLRSRKAKRYWPSKQLEKLDLDVAVSRLCAHLKGAIRAMLLRHKVMMAVTSGIDSRSLLAASRDVSSEVYYFINKKPPLTDQSADIRIPKTIFEKIGLPFHVHDAVGPVDGAFREVFLHNTYMSSDLLLPAIYNVYYKKHQDRVNLLGVGEIGREYYGSAPRTLTGYYLAHCLRYRRSKYAAVQCEKWLREAEGAAKENGVDIMQLFLWEMLLGTWGNVGNSESDIAIEEFDPYDSHLVYETMLSVDRKHTSGSLPDLFRGMFREMWPELLEFPFNPRDGYVDRIVGLLVGIGIYGRLKRAKYWLDYARYGRSLRR